MRRLYFLVPDIDSTRKIVDELLLARVEERHMHVIAREGTPMEDLPEAKLRQKSDLVPAVERGVAVGGATGILAGIVAVTFPPAGLALGGRGTAGHRFGRGGLWRPHVHHDRDFNAQQPPGTLSGSDR